MDENLGNRSRSRQHKKLSVAFAIAVSIIGVMAARASTYLSVAHAEGKAPPAAYPRVCGVKGKTEYIDTNGKTRPLVNHQIFYEKAAFTTGPKSQLCVELSKTDRLVLVENSQASLPVIGFDNGKVEEIVLTKGRLRLLNVDDVARMLTSDLLHESLGKGDVVLSYNHGQALSEITVIDGKFHFRGLENEDAVDLEAGESAAFQGEIQGGDLQFDILLKGKRVARGQLSAKKKLTSADLADLEKEFAVIHTKSVAAEKPVAPVVAGKPKKAPLHKTNPDSICSQPEGLFNQCTFVCEHNPPKAKTCLLDKPKVICVRYRCNANGYWEERFEYSKEKSVCGAKPRVADCDY